MNRLLALTVVFLVRDYHAHSKLPNTLLLLLPSKRPMNPKANLSALTFSALVLVLSFFFQLGLQEQARGPIDPRQAIHNPFR